MADLKSNAAVRVLAQHGEKIALGTACLVLAGYLAVSVTFSGEDPRATNLRTVAAGIDDQMRQEHPPLAPGKTAVLGPPSLQPYSPGTPAIASDPWATAWATEANVIEKGTAAVAARHKMIGSVRITGQEIELGAITITFEVDPVDTSKHDEAAITKFIVERRPAKGGDAKKIELPGDARSCKDADIEPKKDYLYKVIPVTDDTQARNVTKGQGKPSNEIAVTSLGIWKFYVQMVKVDETGEGKGQAFIQIEKFDKTVGGPVKSPAKFYGEGTKLGFWDGTSVHRISLPGGRSAEVDFNCGATLKSVETIQIKLPFKKCVTKRDGKGNKIGCDTVKDERKFERTKVVIVNDDKKEESFIHPDYPKVEDQMCEDHREKAPGGGPDPAKKKLEDEAVALIAEADKLWETDKKGAAAKYEKLLKEFATTDTVAKDKKRLEDRIKESQK